MVPSVGYRAACALAGDASVLLLMVLSMILSYSSSSFSRPACVSRVRGRGQARAICSLAATADELLSVRSKSRQVVLSAAPCPKMDRSVRRVFGAFFKKVLIG